MAGTAAVPVTTLRGYYYDQYNQVRQTYTMTWCMAALPVVAVLLAEHINRYGTATGAKA